MPLHHTFRVFWPMMRSSEMTNSPTLRYGVLLPSPSVGYGSTTNIALFLYEPNPFPLQFKGLRCKKVTVISAADRQLRIVQGYLDGRDGYLRARKSPILDFSQYNREKVELVLSWCIGDAVGYTGP